MKTTIVNKLIPFAFAVTISLTALAAEDGLAPLGNMADELEDAIFLQEAKSELGQAIKKYQKILETESLTRTIAAEAQFRLAECYWEQGNKAQAKFEYDKLKSNYPDEEKWIEAADERLPVVFEATVKPIVDGERFLYQYKLPTGVVFGHSETKNQLIEVEGRELWRRESRRHLNGLGLVTVDFDPVTNDTVHSSAISGQFGSIDCQFDDEEDSVSAYFSNTNKTRDFSFPGRTFDNEQVMELLRQFPVEVGYRTELNVFVNFTAVQVPIVCEILDIFEKDTVFGSVECYRVQIDIAGMQQFLTMTTDDRRIVVHFELGGVEGNLIRSDFYEEGVIRGYTNERYGFSFAYSDDWTLFENSKNGETSLEKIYFLAPGGLASLQVLCNPNSEYDTIVPGDFEATVNGVAEKEQSKWKDYDFGEEPYSIRTINGMNAAYFRGTRSEGGKPVEEMAAYFILGADYHYSFVYSGPADEWEKLEEGYLEIVESISE